jgi:hypothetical protein
MSKLLSLMPDLTTVADIPLIVQLDVSRGVKHGMSQKPIRSGLVIAAIGFAPCDDLGI